MTTRTNLLRRGIALEVVTVGWNVVEGVIAVTAGLSRLVDRADWVRHRLLRGDRERRRRGWRLWTKPRAGWMKSAQKRWNDAPGGLPGHSDSDSRRTSSWAQAAADRAPCVGRPGELARNCADRDLSGRHAPCSAGLLHGCCSKSRGPCADAYETLTCAWLSLTTLAGLVLNAALGWWWADPLAALAIVPLAIREGLEGWRGVDHCHAESH